VTRPSISLDEALRRLRESRPVTLTDAIEVLNLDPVTGERVVDDLVADERLTRDGEHIGYPSPGIRATARIHARLDELHTAIAGIDRELTELPWHVDEWAVGLASDSGRAALVQIDSVEDIGTVYRRRFAGRRTPRLCTTVPDIRLTAQMSAPEGTVEEFMAATGMNIDVLFPARDLETAARRAIAAEYMVPGIRYRSIPDVPHWLIVTLDTVIVNATGREGFVLVQDLSVAALAQSYFDALWAMSVAVAPEEAGAALLEALAAGATVEAAAAAIGISPRTAHRRLAELMEAYGATSLFALGAAWARARH